VSADFLRRMRALGYAGLSREEYVRMRDHGVTPDFVESMKEVGADYWMRPKSGPG